MEIHFFLIQPLYRVKRALNGFFDTHVCVEREMFIYYEIILDEIFQVSSCATRRVWTISRQSRVCVAKH